VPKTEWISADVVEKGPAQDKGREQDSDQVQGSGRPQGNGHPEEGRARGSVRPVLDPRLANDLPAQDLALGDGLRAVAAATRSEISDQVERLVYRPHEAAQAWAVVAVAASVAAACAVVAAVASVVAAAAAVAAAEVVAAEVVVEGAPI
jgi:hypothetical protein